MIVVGGRNSANTSRLISLCRESGKPAYHVEVVDEIRPEWLRNAKSVGVTAGASTPGWVIDAVVDRLRTGKF
jgi:4-hydroxy-3-methylbut-2-enyl diphosphate reductase